MSKSPKVPLMPRSTRNRRLSRTQVLIVLAALISPCVLPLVMSQAMASLAPACLPPSRLSYASNSQFCPTTLPACRPICRNKSVNSSRLRPKPPSGCRTSKRGPLSFTRLLRTCVQTCVQALSLYSPHQYPLLRLKVPVQTGTCQRLQDPRAPVRTDGPLRTTLPARVSAFPSLLGKDKSLPSHRHRRHPKNGINKTKSSFAVLSLSGSLVVRTRTLS